MDSNRQLRSCSCGGLNEHCQRCFGRGWIDNGASNGGFGSTAGFTHWRHTPKQLSPLQDIPQPNPGARVASFGHGRRTRKSAPLVSCSRCGNVMGARRLERHLKGRCKGVRKITTSSLDRGAATQPFNGIPVPRLDPVTRRESEWIRCRICATKLKKAHLERHLRRAHREHVASNGALRNLTAKRTLPNTFTPPMVGCPICHARVTATNLANHV